MIQSVYEEIVVRGEDFVKVRLTPGAYAHGLALTLPVEVVVAARPTWGGQRRGSNTAMARPTGVKPTGTHPDEKSIPIRGADVWEVATMRSA